MCSDDVPVRAVVSQGCRPIGTPLTVTSAERNLVHELAGQPAMARLQEIVQAATDADRELMRNGLHLGVVVDEHRLDFSARRLPRAQRARRRPAQRRRSRSASRSTSAQTVQFQVRDARRRRRGPARAARRASAATRALLFTCNGRGTPPVRRARATTPASSRSCSGRCRSPAPSARARSARSAAATSCTASPRASPSSTLTRLAVAASARIAVGAMTPGAPMGTPRLRAATDRGRRG